MKHDHPRPTDTAVPVAAMEAMLAVRFQQIHDHGHTPERDMAAPLHHFAREVENMARAIAESIQFRQDKAVLLRRTAKLGAFCMALHDRIEGEQA